MLQSSTMMMLSLLLLLMVETSQGDMETTVLERVQEMMQSSQGRVTFSDLHNNPAFSTEERAFLGRLYEVFFEIPSFLKSEFETSGRVPTREESAVYFGISVPSLELLLRVMESDRRVPPLFTRDQETREIRELNLANIDAFVESRGTRVKVTRWEGAPLPSFELDRLDGGGWASSELSGHNSLLYFWFTGCPPCVRIAPILADLEKQHRNSGFKIIGLNADDVLGISVSEEIRRGYLEKSGTEYPNLRVDEKTREAFGNINVYPTLFFVDPAGRIVRHLINFQDRESLEEVIREMLSHE